MTSCPLRVLLPNLGAHVVGVGNMGLLDHVLKPQALTKPSEWAYTVEVVCLDAQPWWPIKNHAPQVRMEGRRSANVTSYFGYHTFSYFHLGLRSDWVSIAVRLDIYISISWEDAYRLSRLWRCQRAGRTIGGSLGIPYLKATQVRYIPSLMHELFMRPYNIYCIYEVLESGHTASPILLSSLPAHPSTNRSTIPHDGSGEEL